MCPFVNLNFMSSHHFVREDQEPGLFIYEWVDNAKDLIDQLAQWAPKIVVHEQALEQFLIYGFKADVVLYNKREEWVKENISYQFPVTCKKAKQSFNANLEFVKNDVINRFNVIGNVTIDDLNINTFGIVFYTNDCFFHSIKKGFQKWVPDSSEFITLENGKERILKGGNKIETFRGEEAYYIQKY